MSPTPRALKRSYHPDAAIGPVHAVPHWPQRRKISKVLTEQDQHLGTRMFMMGEQFTVVDAYVLAIARWCNHPKVMLDLEPDASLGDSLARVGARQAVQEALKAEGLAS